MLAYCLFAEGFAKHSFDLTGTTNKDSSLFRREIIVDVNGSEVC